MELLDSGEDKVKKICDAIREQTLDPAKQEAKDIVNKAIQEAERIVKRAHEEAQHIFKENEKKIQQQKNVLHSALNLSCKQALQALKQEIEENLFSKELSQLIQNSLNESAIAKFITVICQGLEKEGVSSNLEVFLSKNLSKEEVAKHLSSDILSKIKGKTFGLSSLASGLEVKVSDKNMTIELSEEVLKQLLSQFVREDFRELIFSATL